MTDTSSHMHSKLKPFQVFEQTLSQSRAKAKEKQIAKQKQFNKSTHADAIAAVGRKHKPLPGNSLLNPRQPESAPTGVNTAVDAEFEKLMEKNQIQEQIIRDNEMAIGGLKEVVDDKDRQLADYANLTAHAQEKARNASINQEKKHKEVEEHKRERLELEFDKVLLGIDLRDAEDQKEKIEAEKEMLRTEKEEIEAEKEETKARFQWIQAGVDNRKRKNVSGGQDGR